MIVIGSQGEVVSLPPLWATSVNDGSLLAYGMYTSVTYQNAVLCSGVVNYPAKPFGRAVLNMLDIQTGKKLWTWNDYITDYEGFDVTFPYQYNNLLVINNGPRNYCIDLATGQTRWKRWRDSLNCNGISNGIGKTFYMRGDFPSTRAKAVESGLYKGDVLQPSSEQKVVIPNVDVNPEYLVGVFAGGVVSHLSFKEGNDTLSAITYFEQTSTRNVVNLFLGLFNGTNHKWVYDRVLIGHVLPQGFPVKQDNLLFNSVGNTLTCHEWMTGKPIWDKRFNGDFLFSGFLIADNILVANCGDAYIYGLNPATGDQLWKERSSGTSTRMHYQNGVVYYAGGGDGLLHAVEVQTGKHLWKLQSPDVKQDSRAFYNGMVAGVPGQGGEKGKIFVNTGLHIYAYEAAR